MQTGKILGIGAVLSAGLLAAHVASASVVTGLEIQGFGLKSQTLTVGSAAYTSGELYSTSAGSGSYGVSAISLAPKNTVAYFTWTSLTVSDVATGGSGLTFSVDGLTNADPGAFQDTVNFVVSGTGFTFLPTSGDATLAVNGSGSYTGGVGNGGSGSDSISTLGSVNASNSLYGATGSNVSTSTVISYDTSTAGSYTLAPASIDATQHGLGNPTDYSLTDVATFTIRETGADYGGTFGTTLSGTASAVTLPGSGPLTVVGGLVVVGGLAIRRRMKV